MKKIIPINNLGDLAKIINHNTDCVNKAFKQQSRFNGLVALLAVSVTLWAYSETANSAAQTKKIRELEERVIELEKEKGLE